MGLRQWLDNDIGIRTPCVDSTSRILERGANRSARRGDRAPGVAGQASQSRLPNVLSRNDTG